MREVRHWHRLPRGAVDAPSLEVLKARLDGVLGNLVWWEMSLPTARGWNQVVFKVPSNPNRSGILCSKVVGGGKGSISLQLVKIYFIV